MKLFKNCLKLFPILFSLYPTFSWANKDFELGNTEFKKGHYESSLKLYQTAKQSGYQSPELTFNLGSTYYKLGKYKEAEKLFKSLLKHPALSSISTYNLALISEKTNRPKEMKHYLEKVSKDKSQPKLANLAKKALRKIESPEEEKESPKVFEFLADLGVGHDSNVSQAADGTSSSQGSIYNESYLEAGANLPAHFGISGNFYRVHYNDYSSQDYNSIGAELNHSKLYGKWEITPSLSRSRSNLGGSLYQEQTDIALNTKKYFDSSSLEFKYLLSLIDATSSRNYLDGNRNRFRLSWYKYLNSTSLRLRYQLELNNRDNSSSYSYSPTRSTYEVRIKQYLSDPFSIYFRPSFRKSDYSTVAGFKRVDKRVILAFGMIYRLSSSFSLKPEYNTTRNQSNQSSSDYKKNVISLNLTYYY